MIVLIHCRSVADLRNFCHVTISVVCDLTTLKNCHVLYEENYFFGWLHSTVGRTSVLGRRAFTVLRSTCSRRVTIYVDKPSAAGQPTRPTQPFILFGVDKLSSEQLYQMCAGSAI